MVTPPANAAAKIAGIDKIFKIGGAQAIAALAYGTETIEPVDMVVGPGNAYVAAAKRQVFGKVGIDMIAGPSEIMVVADQSANPEWIAADLLSQAEHDVSAQSILVTNNADFAYRIRTVFYFLKNGSSIHTSKSFNGNKCWRIFKRLDCEYSNCGTMFCVCCWFFYVVYVYRKNYV